MTAALALGGTAYAGSGIKGHGHSSTVPPPHSHGHCKDGSKPPCKVGHDHDNGR